MKTTLVPREHIPVVWERIKKFAERCAVYTYGRFTAEDMLKELLTKDQQLWICLLYTSPSPRDRTRSRMPSSA